MKAKSPSQAKPLILFDVTPVTHRREGWGGDSQWGHIFAQPARTPANAAGRAADSQDNRQDGSRYIITRPENTRSAQGTRTEAVSFNGPGPTAPAAQGFSNPNPASLCFTACDTDVVANSERMLKHSRRRRLTEWECEVFMRRTFVIFIVTSIKCLG